MTPSHTPATSKAARTLERFTLPNLAENRAGQRRLVDSPHPGNDCFLPYNAWALRPYFSSGVSQPVASDDTARARALNHLVSTPGRRLGLVLAVAALLFFTGLGSLPLLEPDDGRNAEVARAMLVSGDWITPHFDALTYLDKPAMFFWLVAGSFRLFGISEWAARFPSALAALATALLTWWLARRMFDDATALRAAVVWATAPLVIIFARTVIFDMTLTFLVSAALACFWLAETSGFTQLRLEAGLFGVMGLATFEKGPVGFIIPLLSIVAYLAARGKLGALRRLHWGTGLAVFLMTAAPWYVVIAIRHRDYLSYALWQETLLRYATHHAHRNGGILYYVPVFLAGFLPWSFFLLFAGWNRLKRWRALREDAHRAELFLLAATLVIFVFFSLGQSKLPGYVLPATVPLAILMARVWSTVNPGDASGPQRARPDWLTAGFGALLLLGILTAASPQLLRVPSYAAVAGRKIPPSVMPSITSSLFASGVILAAIGGLGRNLAVRRRGTALSLATFALLAAAIPLLAVRWIRPLRIYAKASSSRELARALLASPERDRPIYGYYYFRTSLPFYLGRPVGLVTADGGETTSNYVVSAWPSMRNEPLFLDRSAGSAPAASLPLLVDAADFERLARSPPVPFLVMVRTSHVEQVVKSAARADLLWTAWDYSIVKVSAQTRQFGREDNRK